MKYKLLEHISLTEVDDEVVLLDLNSGSYFGLNHVGAKLMQTITANGSFLDAVEQISQQYQIAPSQVEKDLDELVQQLIGQKLIVVKEPTV